MSNVYFYGKGVGDIYIKAECRSLTKTFVVHDKWFYSTSIPSYSRTTIATNVFKDVFNTPISLPSKFEFELEFTQSASANFITVIIGESSSNYYYNGFGNTKQLTMAISRNNNRAELVNDDSHINIVTDSVKVGYDGTQMYVTANNRTITSNNSEYSLEKFLGLLWGGSSTIHSIAINKL